MKESGDESILCSEEILSGITASYSSLFILASYACAEKLAEFLETPIPANWQRTKQTNLPAMVSPENGSRALCSSYSAV